jgi:NTE family protein
MNGGADELAVVLTGGGARAAYQVGVLRGIAKRAPELLVPLWTGVSAGAINATHLTATPGALVDRTESLAELWSELTTDRVFRATLSAAALRAVRLGWRLATGGRGTDSPLRGMVDTSPLWEHLSELLGARNGELAGVERNLRTGGLEAVAIPTTCYTTGRSVTFVQGRPLEDWDRGNRQAVSCELGLEHVMASSALPFFFPAVPIGDRWYGDGGVRLTFPLSPAVHLGAGRVLAISTRYARTESEADRAAVAGYPPPTQIAGVLLNAIFLDQVEGDAEQMERVNRLIDGCPASERGSLRRVDVLVIRPSQDLGKLANDFEPRLPSSFRFLTRGLGASGTRTNDFLSLVMFQPDYLSALLALGEADVERDLARIEAFLAG